MKYCQYCGAEVSDDAVYCSKCGAKIGPERHESNTYSVTPATTGTSNPSNTGERKDSICGTIAFVFMVLTCVTVGFAIIPLAWMIPMTVSYYNHMEKHEPVSVGFKVCVLIFLNFISGILLLVDENA